MDRLLADPPVFDLSSIAPPLIDPPRALVILRLLACFVAINLSIARGGHRS